MKKLLLILFIAVSLSSAAQSWAAPGATWYYDLYSMIGSGYERIQNIGDTTINGYQYNKLQIFRKWYDVTTQSLDSAYVSQLEFTRADSGVVYYYRDSAEYVLYNFNAQPGETWLLRADVMLEGFPCDTGSVMVDSVSMMIINNDTLRKVHTTPVDWMGVSFGMPVVERIGGLANLFPTGMCVADLPQGFNLRCYYDSTGWTYHNPGWQFTCDDMMSVDEQEPDPAFSVLPDALSHTLTLTGAAIRVGAVIQVYNANGQLLLEETARANSTIALNYAVAASGIYFVTVTSEESRASVPFFVAGE